MDDRDGQVPWYVVNAAQTVEEVQKEINDIVGKTIAKVQNEDRPLGILWSTNQDEANKEN
jgi:hypothetical protein